MERRHRLSRSRDFDAVYRHGRSVSTRSLTLHWFAREDDAEGTARVGLAIPRAVGVGRRPQPAQAPAARGLGRARARAPPAGCDYVLAARPGLAEAAEARGHDWLVEQVREVVGKVTA